MPQRRRQFARASRETAQFAKAGRSHHDGRWGRVGGSAHGELDGLTGDRLLRKLDTVCLLLRTALLFFTSNFSQSVRLFLLELCDSPLEFLVGQKVQLADAPSQNKTCEK
jgi:hypothetical protein